MSGGKDNRGGPEACERVRSMLDDWLDGLLDGESTCRVEAHLTECSACAAWFEQYRAIAADLVALGQAADRMVLWPRPSAKADGEAVVRGVRRLIRWRSWTAIAAVLVVFVGASLYVAIPRHSHQAGGDASLERRAGGDGSRDDHVQAAPRAQSDHDGFSVTCPEGRMAVPMESNNPRIHIVWFYDQLSPAEALQEGQPLPEPADESQSQGDDR